MTDELVSLPMIVLSSAQSCRTYSSSVWDSTHRSVSVRGKGQSATAAEAIASMVFFPRCSRQQGA